LMVVIGVIWAVLVVAKHPALHAYLKGGAPPDALANKSPVLSLQMSLGSVMLTSMAVGSVSDASAVAVHPLASVTVIV